MLPKIFYLIPCVLAINLLIGLFYDPGEVNDIHLLYTVTNNHSEPVWYCNYHSPKIFPFLAEVRYKSLGVPWKLERSGIFASRHFPEPARGIVLAPGQSYTQVMTLNSHYYMTFWGIYNVVVDIKPFYTVCQGQSNGIQVMHSIELKTGARPKDDFVFDDPIFTPKPDDVTCGYVEGPSNEILFVLHPINLPAGPARHFRRYHKTPHK